MRAAVLREAKGPFRIEELDTDRLGPHEVLVDVEAAGVCHSDVSAWAGAAPTPLPTVLGHEVAGVVVEVGDQVADVSPGDRVIGTSSAFCGRCRQCLSGRPSLCGGRGTRRSADEAPRLRSEQGAVHQYFGLSAFAEQVLVHEGALVRIDDRMPFVPASLLSCATLTGLGAVFRTAGLHPGESAVIIGVGGVGLSVVQGCRIAGANQIIAIDSVPWKLELAAALGATETVLAVPGEPVHRQVLRATGGGVDTAFECVGTAATLDDAFAMTGNGGTTVLVGAFAAGERIGLRGSEFIMRGKALKGSSMGDNRARIDIPRYVQMYLDGRLRLDEMVTDTFALDQVGTVFDRVLDGTVARGVLVPRG
jgi:S-(hydroxymethyl)glutathione dehydrogenase/alcohol dehydrogenase